MQDPVLRNKVRQIMPKLNPVLANGIAYEQMMSVDPDTGKNETRRAIDQTMENNAAAWPEGFKYEGNILCTPWKHFEEITREYSSKRLANIAPSSTYMVQLNFSYRGEPLFPRYVLLPSIKRGAITTLNGGGYTVSPVSKDVGFSVLNDTIFIPFRRTKLTFRHVAHHYFMNGKRDIKYVIWSQVHNEMSKRTKRDLDNRIRIESCLAHYFFARFGVTETFKQWVGVDAKVGRIHDFPPEQYPRDQWNIFSSTTLVNHPVGEYVVAVPAVQTTDFVKSMIAGLFYVLDVFPQAFVEPSYLDDCDVWRVILGHMVFGDFEHRGKVAENINQHMHSLEITLDDITREELSSVGIKANSIWDLFRIIMTDMAHHLYETDIDETTMYNKRLTVLQYVLEDFNYAVSMFTYMFQGKRDKVDWTTNELNEGLKRAFKLQTVIRYLQTQHGEFETLSMPGNNMIFRGTCLLVPQDRARTKTAHNKSLLSDNSRLISGSIAEVGQYRNQPKNNPDGRGRLNLFTQVRYDGMIERREAVRKQIDDVQKKFRR